MPGDFICYEVWDRKRRMWLSIAYKYAWRSLCSVMAENHQLHGDILIGEVCLCLCVQSLTFIPGSGWRAKEKQAPRDPS